MNRRAEFALWMGAFILLLVALLGVLSTAFWFDLPPEQRALLQPLLAPRIGLIVLVLLLCAAALILPAQAVYRRYVLAPLRLREQLLVTLNADSAMRVQEQGSAELRALARTVNELAQQRDNLQLDVEQRVSAARARVEEEKNRLAALMAELTQSVVVCNLDGRILLYNQRARSLFQQAAATGGGTTGTTGAAPIGLGRSIFAMLERNLILHGLEQIRHDLSQHRAAPSATFVTTAGAGQLLRVQMAPVLTAQAPTSSPTEAPVVNGYVLILEDITRLVQSENRRDQLLESLTEGMRAALGNLRAAVESLTGYGELEAAQREQFLRVIAQEVETLSQRLDSAASQYADALKTRWPLEEMLGTDLIAAAQRRIESSVGIATQSETLEAQTWLRVDSFSLIQALTWLAARLTEEFRVERIAFRLTCAGRLAHLDLLWPGSALPPDTLQQWERTPMQIGAQSSPLLLRDVVARHGGELWYQQDRASPRNCLRLLLPAVPREAAPPPIVHDHGRPEYYDFDLFRQTAESRTLDDCLLSALTYTVFDTETTGTAPSAGDEIIQIGAVRIVNGRLLQQETFDRLIDPQRSLSLASTRIHGITASMLRGQPPIGQVLPAFRAFCEDTVLVAHNAAFDMRFLQLKEATTGIAFHQPVLDTLLLSAVIHPHQESHSLEAIAARLGVAVIGRHTALGDAIMTAEIFLKMLPLLAGMGIHTLREAREAAQRTLYAQETY